VKIRSYGLEEEIIHLFTTVEKNVWHWDLVRRMEK
jgi:hypothetical protein